MKKPSRVRSLMKKGGYLSLAIPFLTLPFLSGKAQAEEDINLQKITNTPVMIHYNSDAAEAMLGAGKAAEYNTSLDNAINAWETATGIDLFEETTTAGETNILVDYSKNKSSTETLEADANGNPILINLYIGTDTEHQNNTIYRENHFKHLLGHCQGLGNSNDASDIMNSTVPYTPKPISNEEGDIAKIVHIMSAGTNMACYKEVEQGDINQDGSVTPGDAQGAFECFLNGTVPPEYNAEAGNVCGTEEITPGDAQGIFNMFLDIYPYCE